MLLGSRMSRRPAHRFSLLFSVIFAIIAAIGASLVYLAQIVVYEEQQSVVVRHVSPPHERPPMFPAPGVVPTTRRTCHPLLSSYDASVSNPLGEAQKLSSKSSSDIVRDLAALSNNPPSERHMVNSSWGDKLLRHICDIQFANSENPFAVSAKALSLAANSLHWLRSGGVWSSLTSGCREEEGDQTSVQSEDASMWRRSIKELPQVTPASLQNHQRTPSHFATSTFRRVPKRASWVTATNICASCESPPGAFYMMKNHSCFFTLWGVGEASKLQKLTSTSRGGRNVIFKERVASFQYGGVLTPKQFEKLVDDKQRPFTSSWFVPGTSIWLGPYEFDNPGHVIHDALWVWQLTLMLREIHRVHPSKGNASGIYTSPVRGVFSHDFEKLSGDYFGDLSWIVASGELNQSESDRASGRQGTVDSLERSPFPFASPKPGDHRPLVCFQEFIIPGQDRHVDGGGLGLREVVANRLRRHVIRVITNEEHQARSLKRKPQIFIYGRNDVHRRSLDNTVMLLDLVRRIAARHHLPPPSLVKTFQLKPLDQFRQMLDIDVFVAIQGSHLQNSLFMPDDGAIVELAPCRADFVSFMRRYGRYLDSQSYTYVSLCDNVMINYSEKDPAAQNVTLCPHVMDRIKVAVEKAVVSLLRRRGYAP